MKSASHDTVRRADLRTAERHDKSVAMVRLTAVACALLFISPPLPAGAADESQPSPASPSLSVAARDEDLRSLRLLLEQQSRQLETLTQQISRLNRLIESRLGIQSPAPVPAGSPAAGAGPADQSTAGREPAGTEAGMPGTESPQIAEPASPPAGTAVPAATPAGLVHVVAKGDNLTKIAKRYNVSVADLLKVNRIEDERKLQIGQALVIPANLKSAPADAALP